MRYAYGSEKVLPLSKKKSHHARNIYWSANQNIQHEEMLFYVI
ncbi:hypothetical protein [Staphylococcus epidermidis]|nr:hypothetical protein [Staphylococcus epidermidis]